MFLKANAKSIKLNFVDVACGRKIGSREITGEAKFAKMKSRKILSKAQFAKFSPQETS